MKKQIINSLLIIIAFMFSFYGKNLFNSFFSISIDSYFLSVIYTFFWWVWPSILITGILFGFKNLPKEMGLQQGFLIALIFSIVTVLPMLLSSAIMGKINETESINSLLHKTILSGFFEEYLFRGFLFGLLYRKLKWGFIPASILGGVIFGMGHLYQGSTFAETLGVFTVTSLGAVWFAWLYIEWNNNLWMPIFLHTFMNLSWILFDVSSNALGGVYSNVFRAVTIALTIIITLRYNKKRGIKIKKANLIVNKEEEK